MGVQDKCECGHRKLLDKFCDKLSVGKGYGGYVLTAYDSSINSLYTIYCMYGKLNVWGLHE